MTGGNMLVGHDEDANDDIDDDQGHEHSFLPLSPLSHLVYLRGDNFG